MQVLLSSSLSMLPFLGFHELVVEGDKGEGRGRGRTVLALMLQHALVTVAIITVTILLPLVSLPRSVQY